MQVDFFKLKEENIQSYALVKASWLQKAIRRGKIDTALSLAKVYIDDGHEKALERKLLVCAAEDVGLGNPYSLIALNNLDHIYHKVEYLARSPKNRETDRFLLSVRDNSQQLLKNKELYTEVNTFLKILQLSSNWFEKKNKKNKEQLIKAFEILKEMNNYSNSQQVIQLCLDSYLEISKKKAFGARTLLSLATLLSIRNLNCIEYTITDFKGKFRQLKYVDDYALDKHTFFGQKLNRGIEHWLKEGSKVYPERQYKSQFLSNGSEKYPY